MRMRRWGRTLGVLVSGALIGTTLGACIGPFATSDVKVAPPGIDPVCVVGSWKQTEGWQRIVLDDDSTTEVRLRSGAAELTIDAAGTAKVSYAADTTWQGKNGLDDIAVTYTGTGTLTYSAVNGEWRQVSDLTKRTATITVGTNTSTGPGSSGGIFEGTYRCDESALIISNKDTRNVYART
jgi:hypothetical protein